MDAGSPVRLAKASGGRIPRVSVVRSPSSGSACSSTLQGVCQRNRRERSLAITPCYHGSCGQVMILSCPEAELRIVTVTGNRQDLPVVSGSTLKEFLSRHSNIGGNLTQKGWGDVSPLMHGNRCPTPIGMSELFMRTSLPNFHESQSLQDHDHLSWFEYGQRHGYFTSTISVPMNSASG